MGVQVAVERLGGLEIAAERLFEDDVPPRRILSVALRQHSGFGELVDDRRVKRGGHREVERPVGGEVAFRLELVEEPVEPAIEIEIRVVAGDVVDLGEKRVALFIRSSSQERAQVVTEAVVAVRGPRAADDARILVQQPAPEQVVERRKKFPLGKVARSAEDDERPRGRMDFHTEIAAVITDVWHDFSLLLYFSTGSIPASFTRSRKSAFSISARNFRAVSPGIFAASTARFTASG